MDRLLEMAASDPKALQSPLVAFALTSFIVELTPGPNMAYLDDRSWICRVARKHAADLPRRSRTSRNGRQRLRRSAVLPVAVRLFVSAGDG